MLSTFLNYFETFLVLHLYNKYITSIFTSSNKGNNKDMPQFNLHTPKTQSDMKAMRMSQVSLPVGLIGENNNFAYGYDGEKYYVTEGAFQYVVTRMHLAFEEAKQLFEALTFENASEPCAKVVNNLVKSARKQKLNGNDLFWHFVKGLR